MLTIDDWEIRSVVNGSVRLDGGAMFGVVPRVLWQREAAADDQHRILLTTRTLLAIDRSSKRVILADTGCGTKWAPDKAERFAIEFDADAVPNALRAAGLGPEDVTDVVITHLHFDHNGGLTEWTDERGGATRLRYPTARHWIHSRHLDHAREPYLKDRASFLPEDFAALSDSDQLAIVEGDTPAPPGEGWAWFVSSGHTPCQLHPVFGSGGTKLIFIGDIVPTKAHLPPAWVMAYDVQPLTTITEKRAIYRRCLDEGLLLAFPHDPEVGGVEIGGTIDRPVISRVLPL